MASLNGIDLLVFTGGIGENSPEVRLAVCTQMESLWVAINKTINSSITNKIIQINKNDFKTKILVIPTEEEKEIYHQTYKLSEKIF